MDDFLTLNEAAEILGKSKETLRRWDREGKLQAVREPMSNYRVYSREQLNIFNDFIKSKEDKEISNYEKPLYPYSVIELFAGAGGLAIGLEQAGIECTALNEIDKWACETLRRNRPHWNVLEGDIKALIFQNIIIR
jgi:DNA (cytosine-5)-methyltransferase 1